MNTPKLIRCMHSAADSSESDKCLGGSANVYWFAGISTTELEAKAVAMLAGHSQCQHASVFVIKSGGHYVAESYTPAGLRIQFCGHGAFAAAWWVLQEHAPDSQVIEFTNKHRSWQARRGDSPGADIALIYPRPAPAACEVPEFAARCLGGLPVAAAEVGEATDYLILEFDSPQTVQHLRPDFAALASATRRALIVTAPSGFSSGRATTPATNPATNSGRGCVFRYFAPQYDTPEDAATGSAAVQLAAYWSPRFSAANFAVRQLSAQGACMHVVCHTDTVELLARVGYG